MRVVVTGNLNGSSFVDTARALADVEKEWAITRIISGNRGGVEAAAQAWAKENEYPRTVYYPKPKRSLQQIKRMLQYGDALLVVGTFYGLLNQYYIYEATKLGLFIKVVNYEASKS